MKVSTDFDMQGVTKVTGLPAPSASSDAATKAYVDAITPSIPSRYKIVLRQTLR